MKSNDMRQKLQHLSLLVILLLAVMMFGCEGDKGDRGLNGLNGTSFGTVTGTVTDTAFPPNNIAGVKVTTSPAVQGVPTATTDSNGKYSLSLPNGNYTLIYSKPGYAPQSQSATVVSTQTSALPTVVLVQTAAAVVNVANASFGSANSANLTATVLVNDPSLKGQPATFIFTDASGNVIPSTGNTATVPKPSNEEYVASVAQFATVRQSLYPQGTDPVADANDFDLPFFATLDRIQVLPISQDAFDQASVTQVHVYANITPTGGGAFQTYSTVAGISTAAKTLPFAPNGGIRNVPLGQPVVLQGPITTSTGAPQSTWNWTVLAAPANSAVTTAALQGAASRFPFFTPDKTGMYTFTDGVSGRPPISVYAGTYRGILIPNGSDPYGTLDPSCSNAGCHPGGSASFATPYQGGAQFFDTTPINNVFSVWTSSGHRHIMVKAMTLSPSHYTLNACAKCHSVGFTQVSSAIKSGGFNDVAQVEGFTDATWRANFPDIFKNFPDVLRLSEDQCETCHGPNVGGAHAVGTADAIDSRMAVSSDMCGTCHGEPLRHGRFQEWRESGHGDFQTAMNEGITGVSAATPFGTGPNTNCAGCHTGQGFPLWIQQLQGTGGNTPNPNRALSPTNVTNLSFLRTSNVQPQTCQVCHQVHNPGNASGLVGAVVILRGDYQPGGAFDGFTPLLPAGFQANGVGKGALCITCHNSRNGGYGAFANATVSLHEDGDPIFAQVGASALAYAVPHEACQGDVLMGHNAYYYGGPEDTHNTLKALPAQLGQRSRHSLLPDACVTCHVQKSPTDPALGYPPGVAGAGTNHTFSIVTNKFVPAGDQINALCAQCHGSGLSGTGVQQTFDVTYKQALVATSNAILRIKFGSAAAVPSGSTLTFIPGRTPAVSFNGAPAQTLVSFLASAPGTAATGPIPASGLQLDLAKANWDLALVAPKYIATQLNGTSYDDGTPIDTSATVTSTEVAGDQSKSVHNPSFVMNVLNVVTIRMNQI